MAKMVSPGSGLVIRHETFRDRSPIFVGDIRGGLQISRCLHPELSDYYSDDQELIASNGENPN